MPRKTPKETIHKMRREVLNGKSKYRVAVDMNLEFSLVYRHTKDIPCIRKGEPCIQGKAVDVLRELLQEGYVHSNKEKGPALRRLKSNFPMIQRSQIEGNGIYYLSDRNKQALQSFIEQNNSKVISYQDIANISRIFAVDLNKNEKHAFFGRSKPRKSFKIQSSEGDSLPNSDDSLAFFYIRKYWM